MGQDSSSAAGIHAGLIRSEAGGPPRRPGISVINWRVALANQSAFLRERRHSRPSALLNIDECAPIWNAKPTRGVYSCLLRGGNKWQISKRAVTSNKGTRGVMASGTALSPNRVAGSSHKGRSNRCECGRSVLGYRICSDIAK